MISINILSGLTPFVQLLLVVGLFAVLLLIAFNRTAGTNLATFLHELHTIYLSHSQHKQIIPSEMEGRSTATKEGITSEVVKGNSASQSERYVNTLIDKEQ